MLGSLARKLRALGFDTVYYRSGEDGGLIALCVAEGRVLLTSDRGLASRAAARTRVLLIRGGDDSSRLSEMAAGASAAGIPLVAGEPLCSLCGSRLVSIDRAHAEGVPDSVRASHREFFRCASCGKVYWKGGHWKKLRSLGRRLRAKP